MRPVATDVAWSVCVCASVGHNREPYKTAEPIEMPFGLWTWLSPKTHVLSGARMPHGKGQFWGIVPQFKCIRLCKQQMPAAARGYRFVRKGSSSLRKRGFKMDSPAAGVTSAGAMRPFVKILWPLVSSGGTEAVCITLLRRIPASGSP